MRDKMGDALGWNLPSFLSINRIPFFCILLGILIKTYCRTDKNSHLVAAKSYSGFQVTFGCTHCFSPRARSYFTSLGYFISIIMMFNIFSKIFNTTQAGLSLPVLCCRVFQVSFEYKHCSSPHPSCFSTAVIWSQKWSKYGQNEISALTHPAVPTNSFVPGNVRRDAHFHSFHSHLDPKLENHIDFVLPNLVVQPCPLMSDECFSSNEFAGTADHFQHMTKNCQTQSTLKCVENHAGEIKKKKQHYDGNEISAWCGTTSRTRWITTFAFEIDLENRVCVENNVLKMKFHFESNTSFLTADEKHLGCGE